MKIFGVRNDEVRKKLTEKPEYEQYAERCYGDAHQTSGSHAAAGKCSSGSI